VVREENVAPRPQLYGFCDMTFGHYRARFEIGDRPCNSVDPMKTARRDGTRADATFEEARSFWYELSSFVQSRRRKLGVNFHAASVRYLADRQDTFHNCGTAFSWPAAEQLVWIRPRHRHRQIEAFAYIGRAAREYTGTFPFASALRKGMGSSQRQAGNVTEASLFPVPGTVE
jgi:hypothetical protein